MTEPNEPDEEYETGPVAECAPPPAEPRPYIDSAWWATHPEVPQPGADEDER